MRMRTVQILGILYLLAGAMFFWGIMVGYYHWFPFSLLKEIKDFADYTSGTKISVQEKLANDLGLIPNRFMNDFVPDNTSEWTSVDIAGLKSRREKPLIRLTKDAPKGYRVLFGAFDFEDSFWGAVLLDSGGKVVHTWRLSTDQLPQNTRPEFRKMMYGTDIQPDGSIIFLMQEAGGGIVKVDYCGRVLWTLDGKFHHAASATDDGGFWTFSGNQGDFDHVLALVDSETGRIRKTINMKDVREANPDKNIFDLQQAQGVDDAMHGNDIDPLPARLADAFPQFEPGDLLISYRTINLVFVLSPATLQIKWWRIGPWDRQHDPDWNPGGYFSVFSNNERKHQLKMTDFSDIVAIDPDTLKTRTLVAGSKYNFYSAINGKHEITEAGTILVTSSIQGRFFEVDNTGKLVFEFLNLYDREKNKNLTVSDARYLGPGFFNFDQPPRCEGF